MPLAADKAFSRDLHAQQVLLELRNGVLEEVKLHAQYLEKLGISEPENREPHAATQRYTKFLDRDSGAGGPLRLNSQIRDC